jgi:hypothetical protein
MVITESAPPSTVYVPNSIIVNGVTKTDAADSDNVTVSGNSITVTIGTVPVNGSGTVRFLVRVP